MNSIEAWIISAVATIAATLFATADAALLASHATDSPAVSGASLVEREQSHRAFSMARVLAYIVAGVSLSYALHLGSLSTPMQVATVAIAVFVIVSISEGVARAVGYAAPTGTFKRLAPMAKGTIVILSPAVALGTLIDRRLHAVIPPNTASVDERETSTEQFREVVAAEADVSSAEEELIHGVFTLGETEVQEIMVPRVDIVGIEASVPWSEMLDRIRVSEHARFPVYRETLDEVIGILYAKDVLPAIVAGEEPAAGWLSLIRPPTFIPVSKRIDAQLREFQASHTHIAIVSDEYGGTAGLVTIENILEEIVGEIRDEYDVEEPQIRQEGNTRYWVSGGLPVDELGERLNVDFGIEDVSTVGGLVYAIFGRVPRSGESTTHSGFRIVVEQVRRRRIQRVYFERLEAAGVTDRE